MVPFDMGTLEDGSTAVDHEAFAGSDDPYPKKVGSAPNRERLGITVLS
jgi:hypothetical protein